MKNQWIHFFSGVAKIKVTGKLIEPFLNNCVREKVMIWNLERQDSRTIIGYLMLEDVHKLRRIIRKSDCKLEFIGRKGFPFLLKKSLANSGFIFGIILAFILIILLSNMVWNIEISGANPKIEHDIKKELSTLGIERGKLQFFLPENEEIQNILTERLASITWVGVRVNGTTYELKVVEKKIPEAQELVSPRHLVAKKKAVIYDYFVEQGQPNVKINDFVNQGQILVSGMIGKEGKTETVAAKGKVFGEIWYKSQITIPLDTLFNVYTGNHISKFSIQIFDFSIPIWGFSKNEYKNFQIEDYDYQIKFLKWALPLIYKKEMIYEENEYMRQYDKKTAIQVGKKTAREELKDKLGKEAVIKGEKVLHQSIENGKVKLIIHYQVIEDIAQPQPIIQGD